MFKLKTAYELRISDWSSDVWSSDLLAAYEGAGGADQRASNGCQRGSGQCRKNCRARAHHDPAQNVAAEIVGAEPVGQAGWLVAFQQRYLRIVVRRSEEHTSELQSLMRISYAVFCLKKKKKRK